MKKKTATKTKGLTLPKAASLAVLDYDDVLSGVVDLLETARRTSARATNAIMTATYWEIGRRIVECEQGGASRAEYGGGLVERLSRDLQSRFKRGFGLSNLKEIRRFFLTYRDTGKSQTVSGFFENSHRSVDKEQNPEPKSQTASGFSDDPTSVGILQTLSAKSKTGKIAQTLSAQSVQSPIFQTVSEVLDIQQIAARFPLPWSHYVLLLRVDNPDARRFYENEALRGGWSVRQMDRQISTLFYERTLASKNKKAMLEKGSVPEAGDILTAEQEIKDPLVLEFLGLKDEYSETDLENALIEHLETFLLELGGDFTFVGRQRRLRIDNEWYRIDLLFYHRVLRCLVVIDLKLGKFTHADAGQMMLYLGYAAEHWTRPGENPPVGLVLCSQHNRAVAHYTIDRLSDKILAAEYRLALPDEKILVAEVERTQAALDQRTPIAATNKAKLIAKKAKRKGSSG